VKIPDPTSNPSEDTRVRGSSDAGCRHRFVRLLAGIMALGCTCDREVTIEGRVLSSTGMPVAGAEVRGTCNGHLCAYAASSNDGRYWGSRLGGCDDHCILSVQRVAYRPYSAEVKHHCVKHGFGSRCWRIRADVRLEAEE
jgi:hypothetical protein